MLKIVWNVVRWGFGSAIGSVGIGSLIPSGGFAMLIMAALIPMTWFGTALYYRIVNSADVYAAETAVRSEERAACEAQIAGIQTQINNSNAEKVADAEDAAAKIGPLPKKKEAIIDLCKTDTNCRERKSLLNAGKKK